MQQTAKDAGQLDDELASGIRRDPDQRGNRIQSVKKKMRIDLVLQRGHARLQ